MARFDVAKLRSLATRHRRESIAIAIAFGVIVVSIAAGVMARNRVAAAGIQRNRLKSIAGDVTTFRSAFKQASLEERAFRFPDSLAVAVSRDARFSVAQQLAQRAEQLGLTDVRVRFAPADSLEAPPVPELSEARIAVADYVLAVECRGELAAFLSLVNRLPPSVALQQLGAQRDPASHVVDYHLALAVFESSADTTTLATSPDAVEQVAQLIPFAAAPPDSALAVLPAPPVAVRRDPFVSRNVARVVASGPVANRPDAETPPKQPAPAYRVTTTLMAGARRAALINDQLIYVGESLPDGSTLTAVERDRVVLTDHSGVAHTVAVSREGES
jgi:hypothetical protein